MILEERLKNLEKVSSKLDITGSQFLFDFDSIKETLSQYIDTVSNLPGKSSDLYKKFINSENNLIHSIGKQLKGGVETASGNFFGYIPGGGLLTGAYADLITAVTNKYAGFSSTAPGAAAVENEVIDWLVKLFQMGESAWGVLTSGGTSATLNAFVAALEHADQLQKDRRKLIFYLTEETHHCTRRVLKIMGYSHENIRVIATVERRMDVNDLIVQIEHDLTKDLQPFMIIASAGTTNFGIIDPLEELALQACKYKMWFHVDAAYGGFFKLCKKLDGIERSDSVVLDPHKGMFLPYGIGAVVVKNGNLLKQAYHEDVEYLKDAKNITERSPADYSFELTRHNRALRLQLSLKYFGEKVFVAALEEKLLLTQYLYNKLLEIDEVTLWGEPELTVVAFCFKENELSKKAHYYINNDGLFISSTNVKGQYWLRACLLSFRTHKPHVDKLIESIGAFCSEL